MLSQNSRVDADFYAMIHQHVATAVEEDTSDRRRHKRTRFLGIQWLAPWDGSEFPAESDFVEIRCYDLTRSGFSYFASKPPATEQLVVGFGRKPDLIYVAAEPMRSTHVLVFPSGRISHVTSAPGPISRCSPSGEIGTAMLLVGCRFLRRLEQPPV